MQTISVNKNMDYSALILFLPHGIPCAKTETRSISQKISAPAVTKKSVQPKQSTTIAARPQPKKSTTIATPPKNKSTDLSAIALAKVEQEPVKSTKPVEKVVTAIPKKPDVKPEEKKIDEPKKAEPIAEPKKEEIAVKKIEAVASTPSPLAKALDIQSNVVPAKEIKALLHMAPTIDIPANAQISNNYREVEALRRHAQLQKELVQKWHPPIGVSPDCSCDISFFVNNKGIIEDIKMVKSSNVTMFDISARQALFSMKMPQWTYGNPLVISFKQ